MARDLVYTIVIDEPGSTRFTMMARMLVGSLRACGYAGDILVLTRADVPCMVSRRPGVVERALQTADPDVPCRAGRGATRWKVRARRLIDAAAYRRVLYLDCDCLVVGELGPLLDGVWRLGYQPEYGARVGEPHFNGYLDDDELTTDRWGANAGTFAIAGADFDRRLEAWERLLPTPPRRPQATEGSDQDAWNRIVLDDPEAHAFPEGMIRLPNVERRPPPAGVAPRVIHFAGSDPARRLRDMRAHYLALVPR